MPSHLLLLISCCIGFSALVFWTVRDFVQWKSLGPGGLPHTPAGWLTMSFLRMLKRDGQDSNRLAAAAQADQLSYLGAIVRRQGQRPIVASHPIPQRQLNDLIASDCLVRLQNVFDEEVQHNSTVVHHAQSFFEKHHAAITMRHPECGHVFALISRGEIAHIHPSDGSMHMVLSPCDAKTVLDAQWGELHSLSGLFNRLPVSYTFIYAPRSEPDLELIRRILSASVAFMTKGPHR